MFVHLILSDASEAVSHQLAGMLHMAILTKKK
jgi:hypothetical protein